MSLYKRLLNLTMPTSGKVSDKLQKIDLRVQDELLVIMLLLSLPSEIDHLVVASCRQKILDEKKDGMIIMIA